VEVLKSGAELALLVGSATSRGAQQHHHLCESEERMSEQMLGEETSSPNALFGPNFEAGSEGQPPAAPATATRERTTGRFNGTLRIGDGRRLLLVAGGIEVEVLAGPMPEDEAMLARARSQTIEQFGNFDGQTVSLRGEQRGEYILNSSVTAESSRPTGDDDVMLSPEFARVVEVINRNRNELLQRFPSIISIRPGYRFKDGWITDEPAIVLTVRRKLDESRLKIEELLPRSLDNVRVDIEAATPLDQLRLSDNAESNRLAEVFAEEKGLEPTFTALSLAGEAAGITDASEAGLDVLEALSDITYEPPPDVTLAEVTDAMTVTCHVSPDAGWPTLSDFLDATSERLTIAMYDFTAPHILRRIRSAMSHAGGVLRLILGPGQSLPKPGSEESTKADDLPERTIIRRLASTLRQRFQNTWASVGNPDGVFAKSYHIKVAVRDGRAFWLSSGNWQSSNQPPLDPLGADANYPNLLRDYNREWHVVVEHRGLAKLFERFIEWDIEHASRTEAAPELASDMLPDILVPVALTEAEEAEFVPRYFPPGRFSFNSQRPLRVQPLLTPDNYADKILQLIETADEKLYFQNQSIGFAKNNYPKFLRLINALRRKAEQGVDVRIILRGDFGPRQMLEALKLKGFKQSWIKFQRNCHTKGIIVDSKVAVVSSHNWTNSGTLFNRDAGLIFYDERIARYYEEIFLYDWNNLARHLITEEIGMPLIADSATTATPPGMMRIPWNVYYED
jgi:hypothetical protein